MNHVTSHLVLTDKDRKVIRVDHGVWISPTALDYMDFSFGDTKHIVVALMKPDASGASTVCTNITNYEIYKGGEAYFKSLDLPISKYKLQVVLNWWNAKRLFEMELDLEAFIEEFKKKMRSE
jgi:hypothetical protein